MSIIVKKISWNRTYFEVEYTASNREELMLYRKKTEEWVRFDSVREGNFVKARFNIVIVNGRQPLDAGEWILCERVPESLLLDEDTLYRARPYLRKIAEKDYLKTIPKKKRETKWAEEKARRESFELYRLHPYDVQEISYDYTILNNLDSYQRLFRYSGKYAYAFSLIARANPNDHLFIILSASFFEKNANPKIRKRSVRFREKQLLRLLFKGLAFLIPKKGNRVLFLKENGETPTPNMEELIARMYERDLDKRFVIRQRYRDTFSGRQKIHEWLGDIIEIARADYIFIDDYSPIFNFLELGGQTVLTQVWHAGVGFKSVGYARFGLAGSPDPYASSHRAYTYALVGNKYLREIYSEVFGIEEKALLATGMPRLDHFLDEHAIETTKETLLGRYPWMKKGRVIVFAPTFRGTGQRDAYYPYETFFDLDLLYKMCNETNSYFVFEMHHFIKEPPCIPEECRDRIFDLSDESLMGLYHVSDVLITDYSSCFYDYLLLKKPVVFYTPDKVEYAAIRGFQRSVDELAPGVICDSFEGLLTVLRDKTYEGVDPHPSSIDRRAEGGMLASDRAIDAILLGEKPEGVFS